MVARVWLCPYTDPNNGRRQSVCTVLVEHNKITGALHLFVRAPADTKVVVSKAADRVVLGAQSELPFSVASTVGRLQILPIKSGFEYRVEFDGKPIGEVQSLSIEALAPFVPKSFTIEVTKDVECKAGTSWYCVSYVADGEARSVKHRYSEFADLYGRVRDAYSGSHLRSNVPTPPAKVMNPFANQLDPTFVETRRYELNDFMKKMTSLPRVLVNPSLLDFLELKLPATLG